MNADQPKNPAPPMRIAELNEKTTGMRVLKVIVSVALATVLAGAGRHQEQSLLTVGRFHGNEIQAQSGETWTGLFQTEAGYVLRRARIRVSTVYDGVVDESEEHPTGKEVRVDGEAEPRFLFPLRLSLDDGRVTVAQGEEQPLRFETPNTLTLQKETYELHLILKDTSVPSLGCRIVLKTSVHSQVLEQLKECDPDKWPTLLWAGDLDRDGKLDLIIDQTNHYNVSAIALYLSARAKHGDLVVRSGYLRAVGC